MASNTFFRRTVAALDPLSETTDVPVILAGAPGTGIVILPPGFTVSPPTVLPPVTTMQPSPSPTGAPSILDSLSGSVEIFGFKLPVWAIVGVAALLLLNAGGGGRR